MTPAPQASVTRPVRRAVVPAAGKGTRMRALRGETPKELLPVAGVPMLLYGLIDLLQSGIDEFYIVVAPQKTEIPRAVEALCASAPPDDPAAAWWSELGKCRLHFPVQQDARGLADAVASAAGALGDDPFVCYLPDNIFIGREPATRQVLRTFSRAGAPTVALTRVTGTTAARFGNCGAIETVDLADASVRIAHLGDKGAGQFPADQVGWRTCGLSVLTHEFLEINATLQANAKGEWDDVPILQRLAQRDRLFGHRLEAECFDVGNPAGYAAANEAIADLPLQSEDARV